MLIEITYNVTDVYMSTTETPVYVEISFEQPGGTSAVWGSITGTLSNQTDLQTALDLKVPYSGATGNVNLGEYELKAGQLTLDTSPTGTAAVGTTRWNDTIGSSETTLKGGSVILKNGVDLVARVVNKVTPNTTLTKAAYQAVRVSGAQGQRLAVAFAQANNDNNSADTIGLVIETIPTNQEGFIMTVGQIDGINTTGSLQGETWNDGDIIYLSPTIAGAVTNVKPSGGQHLVIIGYVEYAHANNGKLYIKISNGWELTELHDIDIVSPANNQGLFYESATALWKNKSISTVLGYTPEQPLTFNSPLSRSINSVSIPQATGSVNGFLSSTDWTTFNTKHNALGYTPANSATTLTINGVTFDLSANRTFTVGSVTGSGASGQVAYWTGTSAQSGSNNLFWDATNSRLGIGTNAPTKYFELKLPTVVNTLNNGITITRGSGTGIFLLGNGTTNTTDFVPSIYSKSSVDNAGFYFTASVFSGSSTFPAMEFQAANSTQTGVIGNSQIVARWANWDVQLMQIRGNGNMILQNGGTFTDSGQRLQVIGDTLLKGSGNTSGTTALTVQNSDGTNMWRILNNGQIQLGSSASFPYIRTIATDFTQTTTGTKLLFGSQDASTGNGAFTFGSNTLTHTTGTVTFIQFLRDFTPTSGSGATTHLLINGAINQTGGANGITRGLYVNPTLTAAADWRSIEWSNNSGWGLYGAGTANSYFGGSVGIGTTSLLAISLAVNKNITGNIFGVGIGSQGRVQSDVTNSAFGFYAATGTQAATFTLPTLVQYQSDAGTFGAGSTVTDHVAFRAANIPAANVTNAYAFQGGIASGSGRWNLYMNGTAANYMNGELLLGSTTNTGEKLQVTGTMKVTGNSRINGNLGINTALPTWNSSVNAIQISGGVLWNFGGTNIYFGQNYYYDTTGNRLFINNGTAGEYRISGADHFWYNSASGTANGVVSFTQRMALNANGRLIIGNGSDTTELIQVYGTAKITSKLLMGAGTTSNAQINLASSTAPTSPNDGDIWFDGTDIKMRIGGVTKTFTLT